MPTDWCIWIIKPIYKKKGSIDDPDNYRGITLLSCIGKLFTASTNMRLATYLDEASIIAKNRQGSEMGSLPLIIYSFDTHWLNCICHAAKGFLLLSSIIKKTFDLVDRFLMWSKLISCGINDTVLKIIYNMFENAKSYVNLGQALSDFFM